MLRSAGFEILERPEDEVFVCRRVERPTEAGAVYPAKRRTNGNPRRQRARRRRSRMIEAAKIWNEPNNKSHWDPNLDPEWDLFAR
jgi:hypothetical protein